MTYEFSVLGKNVVRKDAVEKVKGTATYVPDIQLPMMLHAKFMRSPYAHARIKSIDTSKAEALPGVKCVLTNQNVPKIHPLRKLEYLLDETVHYSGEEVAAVAALTPEIAEEALKLIEIEYEVLTPVFDVGEAIKPDAHLVNQEYGTNIYRGSDHFRIPRLSDDGWLRLEFGDIDKGFKEADYIIERTYDETPMQYNCSPMPRSIICEWAGEKLTCWADTQAPLQSVWDLAQSLGVPHSNIRLIVKYAVGSYGGKEPEKTATLVAIMAKRTGRPVKAVFSRAEDLIGTHHRITYRNYHKFGVKKDGTITSMHSKIVANWGRDTRVPYICQLSALLNASTMLYEAQNSKAESCGVLTNIVNYGPMNGFGDPEAIYSIERLMDECAETIDMDPVEFRFKNCMRGGDKAMAGEQVMRGPIEWGVLASDMDSFPELVQKCAEAAQWSMKWKGWRTPMACNGYKKSGIGIAIGTHHTRFWPCSAIVKMNQDGTANVLSGAVDIGQGYATAISQVVAEALGIRYEDVNPILSDTGVTPAAFGNYASQGVTSAINAAKLAADDAKHKIFEIAAQKLNVSIDDLEARDSHVWVKSTDQKMSIADVCSSAWQITGTANNPRFDTNRDEKTGKIIHPFAAAVTIAEVDVDTETGRVDVTRIVTGHDTGKSINPIIVENQIDLGLTMANGWVRTEEYVFDSKTGAVMNPNLLDYKLMTFLDMPESCDTKKIVVEKEYPCGPFGAKGFSEAAIMALAPAIANAVYNAIGIRLYCGSISPKNILNALERANGG